MKVKIILNTLIAFSLTWFTGMAKAEIIFVENFNDSSGFTVAGTVPRYWDIAPLAGTALYPSQFTQGASSQDGSIFFGSFAKQSPPSPAATMTIILPDLSGYTNLQLTVALAAADRIWEPTHRDSFHIIGDIFVPPPGTGCGTGCPPGVETIDSFLPITYPDFLQSEVHSLPLRHEFQDFTYSIDSSLEALTFAFASTASVEVIGIDSVVITGAPDTDGDTIPDSIDNCLDTYNPDQTDTDGDGVGDACDACPNEDANGLDLNNDGCIDTPENIPPIIDDHLDAGDIDQNMSKPLKSIINNAIRSAANGNICPAVVQLEAFINLVNNQRGRKISDEAADELIAYANSVIAGLLAQLPPDDSC